MIDSRYYYRNTRLTFSLDNSFDVQIWATIELTAFMISASLPASKPLWVKYFPTVRRFLGTQPHSSISEAGTLWTVEAGDKVSRDFRQNSEQGGLDQADFEGIDLS